MYSSTFEERQPYERRRDAVTGRVKRGCEAIPEYQKLHRDILKQDVEMGMEWAGNLNDMVED